MTTDTSGLDEFTPERPETDDEFWFRLLGDRDPGRGDVFAQAFNHPNCDHRGDLMTFADELRAAARELRKQADGGFHPALANWLDRTASLIEGNNGAIECVQSSGMALVTARAINGGVA